MRGKRSLLMRNGKNIKRETKRERKKEKTGKRMSRRILMTKVMSKWRLRLWLISKKKLKRRKHCLRKKPKDNLHMKNWSKVLRKTSLRKLWFALELELVYQLVYQILDLLKQVCMLTLKNIICLPLNPFSQLTISILNQKLFTS